MHRNHRGFEVNANIVAQTEIARLKRMVETLEEQNCTHFKDTLELEAQIMVRENLLNRISDIVIKEWATDKFSYTESPPWYDTIPEHGRLCWVGKNSDIINIIKRFDGEHFVCINTDYWTSAKPLTNDEIKAYLN